MLGDVGGDVGELAVGVRRHPTQVGEGLVRADPEALHQDAFGLADHRTTLDCSMQLLDLALGLREVVLALLVTQRLLTQALRVALVASTSRLTKG